MKNAVMYGIITGTVRTGRGQRINLFHRHAQVVQPLRVISRRCTPASAFSRSRPAYPQTASTQTTIGPWAGS